MFCLQALELVLFMKAEVCSVLKLGLFIQSPTNALCSLALRNVIYIKALNLYTYNGFACSLYGSL